MENYYLVLNFRDAGLFRKHKATKDVSFNLGNRIDRSDVKEFVEPITAQQISNMIHVLFGQRPKPMNRYVCYERNEYLYEKGLNSFLKIESYKDNKGRHHSESVQTKKALHNSWNPVSYMNWARVNRLLEKEELIQLFESTFKDVFKIECKTVTFNKAKEMIINTQDERLEKMFNVLIKNKKTSLYRSIYGKNTELSDINKNPRTVLTVFKGVDKIQRLSGKIMVPVSIEDLEIIKQNKGCATLLDGGVVTIEKVLGVNRASTEGFVKVGDISLEMQ